MSARPDIPVIVAPSGAEREISIDEIEATANTQVRRILDAKIIGEYAEAIQAGAIFPPLTVFAEEGSERYILADGFHRLEAAKAQALVAFLCEVKLGGVHAALGHALGANDQHGLRRTNADKRNAVELALKDPEWTQWSHADISRLCHVDAKFVARIREDMVLSGDIEDRKTTKFNRGGKEISRKSTSSASRDIPKQKLQTGTPLDQIKSLMVRAEEHMKKASGDISEITALMYDNDVTSAKGREARALIQSFEKLCLEISAANPKTSKRAFAILRGEA